MAVNLTGPGKPHSVSRIRALADAAQIDIVPEPPLASWWHFPQGCFMFSPVRFRTCPLMIRHWFFAGMAVGLLLRAGCVVEAATADYLVDVWDTEHNLPSSTVTAIIQTPDGYLWIGTYNGLARFDGVRFVTFDPVNTPELSQMRVQGLFLDANGLLWINTFRGGLTSYRDGVFRNEWPDQVTFDLHTTLVYSSSNLITFVTQYGEVLQRNPAGTNLNWQISTPPPGSRPIFQCIDRDGRLLFLSRDGHILQFAADAFKELPQDGGLAGKRIYTLVADARDRVWAGADNEIGCWNGSTFEDLTPTNGAAAFSAQLLFPVKNGEMWVLDGERFRKMAGREWVEDVAGWRGLLGWASGRAMGMHEDREGGLWFNHYGNGLFHITPDGKYQRLTTQDNLPGDRVGAWFQGSDGGVWVGMDHGGLARLRDRQFHVIGTAEGLPARTALSVCEDPNGAVWIGTAGGGLCRWSNGKITRFPVGASVSANFVFSVFPRTDGGLWLSAAEGEILHQFHDDLVQRATWEVHGVKCILTDPAGRVWMGTKAGIALWSGNDRRFLATNDNVALPAVRALTQTPDGTVWAGADDGTLYRCATNHLQAFRPRDALAEQSIYSLVADASGSIWAGTFRGGLLRFSRGKFTRFTAKQGLPVDVISQILDDRHGRLWLGTHQGIYCVAKSVLNAVADGRTNTLDYVIYGRHDGLPALECSDGYQPACWRGADGRLWFTTIRGVVYVDPDKLTANSTAPPVMIEELRVDGEPVALNGGKIIVPPGHKQFDFRFTALSFDAGDKARFRYRLDGLDADWVDADNRRTAQYRNLEPRDYRLRVIACNSEGVWNGTGAAVRFEVQPFFYQTWWFKTFAGVVVVGGISLAVRRAVTRKYRRQLALLRQQHAIERDRARIAKDIHDDIGAGLTQITLLTELARREPEQVNAHLERISGSARQLTRAMDEIVWAVDPQHDTFSGLMDYISAFAEDFLRTAGIRCRMDVPLALPVMRVDAELRYNLFLALKEALNNVVKHAKATEVWLRLRLESSAFTLTVEDDGQGLPAGGGNGTTGVGVDRIASGSGLVNLQKRLAAVGGRCEIHSLAGRGTRVEMTVAIHPAASPVMAIGQNPPDKLG
jgi:signal transduction histidine kinase/ligand-binding sensor domain-containing protein